MFIGSVLSVVRNNPITQMLTGRTAAPQQASTANAATPATSVDVSKAGDFFGKLEKLKAKDPSKFKQVMANIAATLQNAAQNANGTQAQMFTDLSGKFQYAAATGDLSRIRPHGPQALQGAYGTPNPLMDYLNGTANASTAPAGHAGNQVQQVFSNISGQVDKALAV